MLYVRRSKRRVDHVDIEGDIDGVVANNFADAVHDALVTDVHYIFSKGDLEADFGILVQEGLIVQLVADTDVLPKQSERVDTKVRARMDLQCSCCRMQGGPPCMRTRSSCRG